MVHLLQALGNSSNSLIVIATTIIGGVITLIGIYFKWHLDNKKGSTANHSRFKSLNATFYGSVLQDECKDQCELKIKVKSKNRITGRLKVYYKEYKDRGASTLEMEVFGNYYYDSILALQYVNIDKSHKQVGVLLLEYKNEGKTLSGDFMGFGPVSNNFKDCKGQLHVNKK